MKYLKLTDVAPHTPTTPKGLKPEIRVNPLLIINYQASDEGTRIRTSEYVMVVKETPEEIDALLDTSVAVE